MSTQAKSIRNSRQFLAVLERGLSSPPVRAGMRLVSERDLASTFDVNRKLVRKAIQDLVGRGVLVRRQGSGTYLRKVPDIMSDMSGGNGSLASQVIADLSAEVQSLPGNESRALLSKHELRLALWGDWQDQYLTHRMKLGAVVRRVEALGHCLIVNSLLDYRNEPIDKELLKIKARTIKCDGCLVVSSLSDIFKPICDDLGVPVVYVGGREYSPGTDPVVLHYTTEAARRGITLLAGEGFERIGLLALREPSGWNPDVTAYESAMTAAGLDYRAVEVASTNSYEAVLATKKMFSSQNPPEALYVADDYIMKGVVHALETIGAIPGKDIAVIALTNKGKSLPPGYNWSRLEFDPELLGQEAIDMLIRVIQTAGARRNSVSFHAAWCPGDTHRLMK